MRVTTVSLSIFYLYTLRFLHAINYVHPDAGLNSKQMIQKYGYPLEVHKIETEDGYILETYRIPYGKSNGSLQQRYPVLLIPGILCTSLVYLNLGPGISLGYMLADEGYDVWLTNTRGTRWSKRHKNLDPVRNEKQFFDYSFHELGIYDVTANIDYILKLTKFKKIFTVGHSQGTTALFVMLAVKPQYNEKIMLMTALSPVVYLFNIQNILLQFTKFNLHEVQKLADKNKAYEFLPYSPMVSSLGEILCNEYTNTKVICELMFYFFGGYSTYFNKTALPSIVSEYPAGTSTKTFFHYTQLANAEQFQMYDYGSKRNIQIYGTSTPPQYNISRITAPVAVHYGGSDGLSTRADVEILVPQLPNVVEKQFIKNYSHTDFLWGSNIVPVLHNGIIQRMKKYSKQ